MDSRIRRNAIVAGVVTILAVVGIVLIVNWKEIIRQTQTDETKEALLVEATQNEEKQALDSDQEQSAQDGLRDFLQDETFFDEENDDYEKAQTGQELSLLVTSIEKDLRVKIVNILGEPVAGEEFYITIEGMGEYKDLDKDGIIYVGALKPAEYYVSLNDIEGYRIPDTKVKVAVKEKVEYIAIDDISYLILTEDQINAEAEDTGTKDALNEADGTEINLAKLADGDYYFGIDVSKWNNEIDWNKVAAAGVDFAIIRCGYRGSISGSLVEDPYFKANIEGAREAGIKVGLYFFTQAVTEVEAVEEASMVITLCKEYFVGYPIFIDTESAGGGGRADAIDKQTRTLVCKAFCETIQSAGYTPGIYASKNWFQNNLMSSTLSTYAIWLAQYSQAPTYDGVYHLWQYTSKGKIDGIKGNVDLNLSYLD